MEKSESIAKLAKALSLAQGEMPGVVMNATNPFLKNKYADFGAVAETVTPILSKFELSFSQLVFNREQEIGVGTLLMHSSGEWIYSEVSLPTSEEKGKNLAQVAGSVITYLRRYSLASIVGVYTEEDVDGEGKKRVAEKKELTPEEKERTEIVAKVLKLGTELGGARNEKVAAVFKKYTPNLNPNKITDLSELKKLHTELINYKGETK